MDFKLTVKYSQTHVEGKPLINVRMYVRQLDEYVLAHEGAYRDELSALAQILDVWELSRCVA